MAGLSLIILPLYGQEELVRSAAEEFYFRSFEESGGEELLLNSAEEMVYPWSGLALMELSHSYLERPVPPSLGKIFRLWKKYVGRYGYDDYSEGIREKVSLLSDHDPERSPLVKPGTGKAFYASLYHFTQGDGEDPSPLYEYLDEVTDGEELSFVLYYLGSRGIMTDLPRPFTEWLTLKILVQEGEYRLAADKAAELETYPFLGEYAGYYRDLWRVVLAHRDRERILDDWYGRRDTLRGEARWSLLFHSALCRRSMQHYYTSGALLTEALDWAVSSYDYDRTLWYWLDVLDKRGENLAAALEDKAFLWHEPDFFDDLVDRAASDRVYIGQWRDLLSLEEALAQWGSGESRDRLGWIVAMGGREGFLSLSEEDINSRLEKIAERNLGSLYTLMAQYQTGGKIRYYHSLDETGYREVSRDEPLLSVVFTGLIGRDNIRGARLWYERYPSKLSWDSRRKYAYLLRRNGDSLESIRVIGSLSRSKGYIYSREDLNLLYPLEYAGSLEYWCREYDLSLSFFQALVKTESGYDKDIVSYAGAVGLSQLMPATAEERMELMGLQGASLTEPDINIALGTGYMRWLYDRDYISSSVQAAAAYNGGPGSVRKWNRAMAGYPMILYMEGIPFTQTRDYVKSLVQGALVYSFLYEDTPLEQILTELLPELTE